MRGIQSSRMIDGDRVNSPKFRDWLPLRMIRGDKIYSCEFGDWPIASFFDYLNEMVLKTKNPLSFKLKRGVLENQALAYWRSKVIGSFPWHLPEADIVLWAVKEYGFQFRV